jgi:hypothetical protein
VLFVDNEYFTLSFSQKDIDKNNKGGFAFGEKIRDTLLWG